MTGYGFGESTTVAGLLLLPSALVMLGAGPLSGWLGSRFGSRLPLAARRRLRRAGLRLSSRSSTTRSRRSPSARLLVGIGIGLAFAAMANLVVEAVRQDQTGVATGINTIMRSIGGSIGAQVAAAMLAGHLILDGRFPAEQGFTEAFAMSAVAAVVALIATSLIPRPRTPQPRRRRRARARAAQRRRPRARRGRGLMAAGLPRDVRRIAVVVVIGAIMSILDTTIVNVALETLRIDLGAPLSTIQWVSTGYLLALATAIPLTGWAAERFGPRRVWMTAVAAFVVTSGLCGLAWSAESLIGFRVLQGFAGGMIMPIGMITLAQAAGPEPHGPRDEHRRRADAARPGARSGDRRRDRREPVLALDLLREPAGRDRRAPAGPPADARRPRPGTRRGRRRGAHQARLAGARARLAGGRRDRVRHLRVRRAPHLRDRRAPGCRSCSA